MYLILINRVEAFAGALKVRHLRASTTCMQRLFSLPHSLDQLTTTTRDLLITMSNQLARNDDRCDDTLERKLVYILQSKHMKLVGFLSFFICVQN